MSAAAEVPGPPRPAPAARAIRNGCVWLVLIPLLALAVVRTGRAAGAAGLGPTVRSAPRAVGAAAVKGVAGVALALLVHRFAPRSGLPVAVFVAVVLAWWMATHPPLRFWSWIPFMLLLALAAIDAIPLSVHESAAVDRAAAGLELRAITLPLILPLVGAGLLFRIVDGFEPLDPPAFLYANAALAAGVAIGNTLVRGRR